MSLNVSKIGNKNEIAPTLEPGSYPARLVQVVDLGLQPQPPYQGVDKLPVRMIQLTYELIDEFMMDEEGNPIKDRPRWVSEHMPLLSIKSERAKSTQRYWVLDPTNKYGGDFAKLINTPVYVTIVLNPNKKDPNRPWENVANITPVREKEAKKFPELVNEAVVFDLEEPDFEVFKKLPEWVRNKITSNLEFQGSKLAALLGDIEQEEVDLEDLDDEIPF